MLAVLGNEDVGRAAATQGAATERADTRSSHMERDCLPFPIYADRTTIVKPLWLREETEDDQEQNQQSIAP